jgi:hypothetical protein
MRYIILLLAAVGFVSSAKASGSLSPSAAPSQKGAVSQGEASVTSVKIAPKPSEKIASKPQSAVAPKGASGAPTSAAPSLSQPEEAKGGQNSSHKVERADKQKQPLRLKNVRLVVEDYQDKSSEKLVPVDPVVLRQKPKTVSIAEVKRESLVLPKVTVVKEDKSLKGGAEKSADGAQEDQKPILVVSKILEEDAPAKAASPLMPSFSPFHPPPPGAFPSTLNQKETVTTGSQGSELLPLPPISVVGAANQMSPNIPVGRVARAIPTGPNPNLNTQFGVKPPASPSYYTDSESSAILHMATDGKGFEGPSSSVFGQMW